jgi:hypothetical protein
MKKSLWVVIAIAAALLLSGLLFERNERAFFSNGEEGESEEPKADSYAAPPEAPAPLQASGHSITYNFDSDSLGGMPAKFHSARTGQGTEGKWVVMADSTAPSKPNVVAQTSTDTTDYRFPLLIADEGSFKDLELSVKFKAVEGEVDRAGSELPPCVSSPQHDANSFGTPFSRLARCCQRHKYVFQTRRDLLQASHAYLSRIEALTNLRHGRLSICNDGMQAVSEDRRIQYAGSGLQGFERRAERFALHQQELSFHVAALQLRGGAHGDDATAVEKREAIAIFRLVHVVRCHEHRDALAHHLVDQFPELSARNRIDS